MILFFGTREVAHEDNNGMPQRGRCPQCGNLVTFQPKRGRTYFHFFWIPVIPLGEERRYIQCPECKARLLVRTTPNG